MSMRPWIILLIMNSRETLLFSKGLRPRVSNILLRLEEGGKGRVMIPFHAQILTKFTRHVRF